MRERGSGSRLASARTAPAVQVLVVLVLVVVLAPAAYAAPSSSSESSGSSSSPTIDPAAPTPTSPPATLPPQGHGPGGITIGGPELDTRDQVLYEGAAPLPPDLNTRALVVADLTTGQILAAQDPHGRYYPASTLKMLTFLALYPHLDPNQVLTATFEDASVEGSRVGIVENGQYTVAQLWTALMLQSGNDAAKMLTDAAGGQDVVLDLMNAKAEQLQAYDTLAGTTSGLDVAGQSSSAYDLALFIREVVRDPTLRSIAGQLLGELPAQPPKYPAPMSYGNQNQLMLAYPGAIAGKTGFTDAARHTFAAAAERNGRTIAVTLMQAEHQPKPTWQQAAALLDWAFAAPVDATGAGRLVEPGETSPEPPSSASSSPVASQAAADRGAIGRPAAAGLSDSGDREMTTWPLLPILGVLLLVAVWIAAPSRRAAKAQAGTHEQR